MTTMTDQAFAVIVARADAFLAGGFIKSSQSSAPPKRPGTGRNRGKGAAFEWLCRHVNHGGEKCLFWPFSKAYGHPGLMGYCGRVFKPGRLMCLLAHGEPPSARHKASHTCGRGANGCIHPQHLAWRTEAELRQHMAREPTPGRWGKITFRQSQEIEKIGDGEPKAAIAKRYGISAQRVGQILNRRGLRKIKGFTEVRGRFYSKVAFRGVVFSLGSFATSDQATSAYHDAVENLRIGQFPLQAKKPEATFEEIKRFYRPPAQRLHFGDAEGELVIAVEAEQEDSVFLLHTALNDLHPRVKKFVTLISSTGDLADAAAVVGFSEDQLAVLLPRLRQRLGPMLRHGD